MEHLHFFNTDTGNRDLGREKTYSRDTPQDIVENIIRAHALINPNRVAIAVLTSPYKNKPGQWYIKGFDGKFTYEEILQKINRNEQTGLFPQRRSILIKV
jgi:hypothetical protein